MDTIYWQSIADKLIVLNREDISDKGMEVEVSFQFVLPEEGMSLKV